MLNVRVDDHFPELGNFDNFNLALDFQKKTDHLNYIYIHDGSIINFAKNSPKRKGNKITSAVRNLKKYWSFFFVQECKIIISYLFIYLFYSGLDNAGKTTILKRLNGEPIDTISPTLGFDIKTLEHNG